MNRAKNTLSGASSEHFKIRPVAQVTSRKTSAALRASACGVALYFALAYGSAYGAGSAAQDPATAVSTSTGTSNSGDQVEEVTVTARRRSENLQVVPVSASVLSSADIKQHDLVNVRDLIQSIPNVMVSTGSRGSRDAEIEIRGIETADTTPVFDPSIGTYMNGIYVGRTEGLLTDTTDLETVEVLRGPQGTLFGRNNLGGAIMIETKRPTSDFEGEVGTEFTNYNGIGEHAIVNVPLGEDWAARLVYKQFDRDGYGKNLFTGFDNLDNAKNKLWRASLGGSPFKGVDVFLWYEGLDDKANGTAATPIGSPAAVEFAYGLATALGIVTHPELLPAPGKLGRYRSLGAFGHGLDRTRSDNFGTEINWQIADSLSMKLLGGYRTLKNWSETDQDGTPAPLADASMPNHQQQRYAELLFNGTGFDSRLDWVIGGNYFNEEASLDVLTNPEFPFTYSDSVSHLQNESYAVYGHASFNVTDKLSVAGGLRNTWDKRDIQTAAYRGGEDTLPNCIVDPSLRVSGECLAKANAKFTYVSWEASANYQISPDLMVYGRASKGQKSGGFNASVQTGFLNPFNPESLIQYEVGLKSEFWDDRVRLNADVYTGTYDNLQRQLIRFIKGAPSVIASNAGSATIKGSEVEVEAIPFEHLTIQANGGYTDAKYKVWHFVDPVTGSVEDLTRNKFANVPKYTYSLSATYEIPMEEGTLLSTLTYDGRSSYFLSPENLPEFQQSGYGLLSARIAFTTSDGKWEVAVSGSNLTNKYYQTFGSVYPLPTGPLMVPVSGLPRMVRGSVTYAF